MAHQLGTACTLCPPNKTGCFGTMLLLAAGVHRGGVCHRRQPRLHSSFTIPRWQIPAGGVAGAPLLLCCAVRQVPQDGAAVDTVIVRKKIPSVNGVSKDFCMLADEPGSEALAAWTLYSQGLQCCGVEGCKLACRETS